MTRKPSECLPASPTVRRFKRGVLPSLAKCMRRLTQLLSIQPEKAI